MTLLFCQVRLHRVWSSSAIQGRHALGFLQREGGVVEQRHPRPHDQGLAGKATVRLLGDGLGDIAAAACLAAIGQAGDQGDRPGVQLLERHVHIQRQAVQVQGERLGDLVDQHPALKQQLRGQLGRLGRRGQGVQPGVRVPGLDGRQQAGLERTPARCTQWGAHSIPVSIYVYRGILGGASRPGNAPDGWRCNRT